MVIKPKRSDYPEADGKPMSETGIHFNVSHYLIGALKDRYAHDLTTFAAGDQLLYYVEDDNRYRVAPDVYVVFGNGNHERLRALLEASSQGEAGA